MVVFAAWARWVNASGGLSVDVLFGAIAIATIAILGSVSEARIKRSCHTGIRWFCGIICVIVGILITFGTILGALLTALPRHD